MSWPTPHWLTGSVRNKLLAIALLPLLVVFPLMLLALALWGNAAYDRLLITKVRSDLAVARGYFDQVLTEVGSGTQGVADSRALFDAWQALHNAPEAAKAEPTSVLAQQLSAARERLGLDLLVLYSAQGHAIARDQIDTAIRSSGAAHLVLDTSGSWLADLVAHVDRRRRGLRTAGGRR